RLHVVGRPLDSPLLPTLRPWRAWRVVDVGQAGRGRAAEDVDGQRRVEAYFTERQWPKMGNVPRPGEERACLDDRRSAARDLPRTRDGVVDPPHADQEHARGVVGVQPFGDAVARRLRGWGSQDGLAEPAAIVLYEKDEVGAPVSIDVHEARRGARVAG